MSFRASLDFRSLGLSQKKWEIFIGRKNRYPAIRFPARKAWALAKANFSVW